MFYSIYGLSLFSNQPLPSLLASVPGRIDVRVWLNTKPSWLEKKQNLFEKSLLYTSPHCDEQGKSILTVWKLGDAYFFLQYGDGTEFIVDQSGTQIWATWPDSLTLEDTAVYLVGPVLGFVLRLRGVTCLHASAIAISDHAVAFLGSAGAGKSTIGAAFAGLGYPILSDDVVALKDMGESFLVQPAYPCLRLWPDSVSALYGTPDALPRLTPNWDKCYLDLLGMDHMFQKRPLPLRAIYILGEREANPTAPFIGVVGAHERLITLVANTYTNYLLNKGMRAKEFDLLGRMIASVPLRKVIPYADSTRLSKLCDVILEDFQTLPSANSVGLDKKEISLRV